ncbi:MAG TPA: FG-GAP-like repeat-containing protein [Opitutaceae bacterium]|nr:FG-GAP-like repeat-containing protein [Opitutaceae bacterium]
MFVQLPAEETGVRTENRYNDPRMFGDLYQEFEGGSIGTGVAIGDYDGDGRPDIFVVSKTESCRLFRNLGDFRFEDVTEKAVVGDKGAAAGIWKHGVTFVDVNNDGRLDIYVCRYNAPNLLYVNQGDGTFKEMAHAYGLDVKDASVMASFCDYDRDGWLDVYITTNLLDNTKQPNGRRGYLFHNNGDGTFTNVTDRAGIAGEGCSHSATWWDYDNDGWPDLYVANDYGTPDKLYHNNRDGTFSDVIDRVVPHTSFYSMGSDLGDVNNDGLIDFLVADMATTTHRKDQNSIAEARERVVEVENSPAAPKYHRSALYLNTGMGRCLEAAYLAGIAHTDWTWSPRLEDLDNDGRLDLFVTNGFNRDPNPDVYSRMVNAESLAERNRIMYDSPVLVETHLAFRNLGDLRFEDVGAAWGLDQKGVSFGAAFGDLGGDGNLDLVYSNFQNGVSLFRNDNDTGHRVIIDLRGTVSNRFGVGAMVRIESALGAQVRQLWLARGYSSSSEPMVHFGLGDDTVIKHLTVTWPSGHVQTFMNLPVDRRYTITEPPAPAPSRPSEESPPPHGQFTEVSQTAGLTLLSREEPVDESSLQRFVPVRLNRRGPALALGDVDGSGRDAIVVGATTMDPRRVLHRAAPGQFTTADAPALAMSAEINDGPLLLFDADGDGMDDLLVTKGGNSLPAGAPEYQPRLFLNDGHGGFRPAPADALPPLPINAGAAAAADFDRDGRLDLFIGGRVLTGQYPLAPRSALLANRGGHFEDVTDALAPGLREIGMVTAALWSDVDGDGWPDLLLTLEWGSVKYFHNNQGKGFADWSERVGFAAAGTGWWTSIAAADFNGDGRMDYVVGNVGLNTQYHADPAHPAVLFSGDFRGDGSTQLIEGYYEGDTLYPWRSRKGLAAAIPTILRRFPRNDPFARASLGEIVGEGRLAAARRFAATELRSGVFLSQPDGTYRFEPLPRLAQIAPLQGMVTGDFDGDGHTDVYAVQNSYAPIPAVGRFNNGLSQLLRGDGRGHFTPVPVAASGLLVPGDAKALVVLDLDGDAWPDFLVSRNNTTTVAFRNGGVPGHNPLRIILHGPAGNPTAVGARITVELSDGSTQTCEVYAGSGYYSQSTAACFFGYPDANPPKHIHVRWPSGNTTEYDGPPRSTTLNLSAPLSNGQP